MAEGEAPGWFEGIADGADGVSLGDTQERTSDGGEEVGVFVGVDVGDVDAGVLELLDLGECFAFDVVFADLAAQEGVNEVDAVRGGRSCRRGRGAWGCSRAGRRGRRR